MSRIPTHIVDDAPAASRPLLESAIEFSPTGRPLNLHAQMAHSPAVLVAYTSLRRATAEHGTVGPKVSAALMLATASTVANDYGVGITSRLASMMGWSDDQVAARPRFSGIETWKSNDATVRIAKPETVDR